MVPAGTGAAAARLLRAAVVVGGRGGACYTRACEGTQLTTANHPDRSAAAGVTPTVERVSTTRGPSTTQVQVELSAGEVFVVGEAASPGPLADGAVARATLEAAQRLCAPEPPVELSGVKRVVTGEVECVLVVVREAGSAPAVGASRVAEDGAWPVVEATLVALGPILSRAARREPARHRLDSAAS